MTLKEYKAEQMKDPAFAAAYEEIQPEMAVIRAIVEAREASHLTQQELSKRTGIAQTEISKLENGNRNPSIKSSLNLNSRNMRERIPVRILFSTCNKYRISPPPRVVLFWWKG